jgi:hypothetical protein
MKSRALFFIRLCLLVAITLLGGCPNRSSPDNPPQSGPTGYTYPLKVGPNSRYLVDQNGKPFLITGDGGWSIVAQLSNQDADLYLANRQQHGFNTIIVNLIEHKFADLAPADINNEAPFTGTAFQTPPNEAYFAHADYIIQSAAAKGIVVLLDPIYVGYQCGDEGWCDEMQNATDAQMTAWGQFVGNRYKNYDNIIWMIGGDTDPRVIDSPYTTAIQGKVQDVVTGILQYDTRHLFTAHNQSESMAIDPWSGASWLTLNDIYTYNPAYMMAKTAYQVAPSMPFFLIESAYENEHAVTEQNLRAESYWTVLSGGSGHIFGNCPLWGLGSTTTYPTFCGVSPSTWKTQMDAQGSVNMGYFLKLFSSRHWYDLTPDDGTVMTVGSAGNGTQTDYAATAYASDGSSIIAYLPSLRTVTVNGNKLAGTSMNAWWYNPATGVSSQIGTYPTNSSQNFTPPSGGDGDWVLVLDSVSFGFSAPGN